MDYIRYPIALLVALPFAAAPLCAQESVAGGAILSGTVYDSVARAPLVGATIQLIMADSVAAPVRTAVSDAKGRFMLVNVPDGHYRIGFLHPMLDSLTIEPILREVEVTRGKSRRVDLAIPSPARLREAICGPRAPGEGGTVVVGVVRDAQDGVRLSDVSVVAEWYEIAFTQRGIRQRTPRRESMTGDMGWFALCDLPPTGTMALRAIRGADTTATMEVELPADGFARRDLYLGTVGLVTRAAALGVRRPPSP